MGEKEESKYNVYGQHIFMSIKKKESGPHWPRITKENNKLTKQFYQCDWNKYVDEDDEDELSNKNQSMPEDFDDEGMKGFEGGDSDDEEGEGNIDDLDEKMDEKDE